MTVAERVTTWLRENRVEGCAYCDACIQRKLKLSRPQQVHSVTTVLANAAGFSRFRALCYECGEERLVTKADD